MKEVFSNRFKVDKEAIRTFITNYESQGSDFDERNRNSLKLFVLDGETINIKSFKKPNFINSIIYRFFRPSKAQRSFEYAHRLLENDIGTPNPIAYFEEKNMFGFKRSYYVSQHLDYDLTYRELVGDSKYLGHKGILQAFGKFTYLLHSKEIQFLDHSVGNTLITISDDTYTFYLVDLNRMKFGIMDFDTRMKNFERLSKFDEHIAHMAQGYSEASGEDKDLVYKTMHKSIKSFQDRFYRKKRLKKSFCLNSKLN